MRLSIVLAVAFASLIVASPVHADVTARYSAGSPDGRVRIAITVEADGSGRARLQIANDTSYFLMIDGNAYLVSRGPNGPYVVRMEDYASALTEVAERAGAQLSGPVPPDPGGRIVAIGQERVGDRVGTAYTIVSIEAEGDGEGPALAVMSDDASLSPIGRAITDFLADGAGAFGNLAAGNARVWFGSVDRMIELLRKGTPLRIFGLDMMDSSSDDIADERFALPAEPMSREALRAMFAAFEPPPTQPAGATFAEEQPRQP